MEEKTGQMIDLRQQAIFGKGTEYINKQCKMELHAFCFNEGREALSSTILPIIQEKLWPALVAVFGLAELKADQIIVKAKE